MRWKMGLSDSKRAREAPRATIHVTFQLRPILECCAQYFSLRHLLKTFLNFLQKISPFAPSLRITVKRHLTFLCFCRMAQRVTLRKRQPYNTTSSRRRIVKTPGGKLVYHHLKKIATSPKCGDCGIGLPGVRRTVMFYLNRNLIIIIVIFFRSRLCAHVSMRRSRSGRRPFAVRTVAPGVVIASNRGAFCTTLAYRLKSYILFRILRAFLVEEAKIVKKVIKSQTQKK